VFEARQIRIVINDPLTQDSPIQHLRKHDGVKVAALVEDATSA
jgi:hypothetical protein